jgi:hypothetical protein
MPMVVMNDGVHESSQKRRSRHDLPTPDTSVRVTIIRRERLLTRVADEEELDEEVVVRTGHGASDAGALVVLG